MQFSELKTEVFRRLNESESSPVFWLEADVEASINDGYREISDATEWYEEYYIINLQTKLLYYDMRTVLPETFLAPKRIFNQTTNQWLGPVSLRTLDYNTVRTWQTVTGEPQKSLIRGLWWLGFWPKKASDAGKLKLFYTAIPEDLSADTDTPGFPQEFHHYLVEYALYDLYAQDGETAKALKHWAAYSEGEERLRRYVKGRMSMDRIPHV